jgi:hypothetical protein
MMFRFTWRDLLPLIALRALEFVACAVVAGLTLYSVFVAEPKSIDLLSSCDCCAECAAKGD